MLFLLIFLSKETELFFLDLEEEFVNLPANGGIIAGKTGAHCTDSDRAGEIPMICKRYLLMLFNDVMVYSDDNSECSASVSNIFKTKSYGDVKKSNVDYVKKKRRFFELLKEKKLGVFPESKHDVDNFVMDVGY